MWGARIGARTTVGAIAGVAAFLLAGLTALPAAGAPAPNWVVAQLQLTQPSHLLVVSVEARGPILPGGPGALGLGTAGPFDEPDVFVTRAGSEPTTIAVTAGAQERRFELTPDPQGTLRATADIICHCTYFAGMRLRVLFFVTGMAWSELSVTAVTDREVLTPALTTGNGASAIVATAGAGVAASAGPAVATVSGAVESGGLVGAIDASACDIGVCAVSWTTAEGRQAGFTNAGPVATGSRGLVFASGPGFFDWTFTGLARDALLGAYAPVGAAWSFFD